MVVLGEAPSPGPSCNRERESLSRTLVLYRELLSASLRSPTEDRDTLFLPGCCRFGDP